MVHEYKPRSPLTTDEAVNTITRRELRHIRERFDGLSLLADFGKEEKLEDCLFALVWLFERRDNPDFTLDQLDDFTLGEVQHYFTEATPDGEPTDAGKDSTPTPASLPSGAS